MNLVEFACGSAVFRLKSSIFLALAKGVVILLRVCSKNIYLLPSTSYNDRNLYLFSKDRRESETNGLSVDSRSNDKVATDVTSNDA
jgi:hypothetical protein